jgi:hypothetical protein
VRRPLPPALLGLALLAAAAGADEARWSRWVEVERPGTVVLELDGRAAERSGIDLGLVGPDGREVHFAVIGPDPTDRRQVKVTRVEPNGKGWLVELDAGLAPPRHDRLRFALAKETAAADVLLEGGGDRDGGGWRELARGSLFRLGSGDSLQNFELSYQPTEVRLLRLSWPREAGLPELVAAEIAEAPGEDERYPVPIECKAAGKVVDCFVDAPAGCRSLEVALAPREAPLGYRLFCDCSGWRLFSEGERRQHGRLSFAIPGGGAGRLRLNSEIPPEVEGASCRQRRNRLVFEAETAGAYRLVYGRTTPLERRAETARSPEPARVAAATLGPEVEGKAPAWPAAAAPGAPLKGRFERSWPIERSSSRGQLLALTLTGEVAGLAGGAVSGLRIDSGGVQLPYVHGPAAYPEKLLAATLRPTPVEGSPGRSRIEIAAPENGHRLELLLFADGPFARQVNFIRHRAARRPGREAPPAATSTPWSCPASLARGCLLQTLLYYSEEPPDLIVEFLDGDNPPLPEVAVELWTERTVLYFVDPGGPLALRWDGALGEPAYDLAGLEPLLVRGEAAAAALGPELPRQGAAEAPRWLLLAAIAVAAVALLAVLARVLRQGPA